MLPIQIKYTSDCSTSEERYIIGFSDIAPAKSFRTSTRMTVKICRNLPNHNALIHNVISKYLQKNISYES